MEVREKLKLKFGELEKYINQEQVRIGLSEDTEYAFERDSKFLDMAKKAIVYKDYEIAKNIVNEEMRGLLHYFGGYCEDSSMVLRLISDFNELFLEYYLCLKQKK